MIRTWNFSVEIFFGEKQKFLLKAFFTPAANRDLKPSYVRIWSQISIFKHVRDSMNIRKFLQGERSRRMKSKFVFFLLKLILNFQALFNRNFSSIFTRFFFPSAFHNENFFRQRAANKTWCNASFTLLKCIFSSTVFTHLRKWIFYSAWAAQLHLKTNFYCSKNHKYGNSILDFVLKLLKFTELRF